tara:strand:+ start:279 stop:395 length:117 start_codon:yes stop_codon:yes gene_type:complete
LYNERRGRELGDVFKGEFLVSFVDITKKIILREIKLED